jgi:hypothetical protein
MASPSEPSLVTMFIASTPWCNGGGVFTVAYFGRMSKISLSPNVGGRARWNVPLPAVVTYFTITSMLTCSNSMPDVNPGPNLIFMWLSIAAQQEQPPAQEEPQAHKI